MAAILLPILEKFGKWVVVIGVIVGLFLWGRHYQLDSRQKETELAQSQQTITQMKSDYAKYQEQQTALLKQEQSRQAKTITIIQSIANAKETNSCASSPAIRNVLAGLRDHNSTASTADNSGQYASLPRSPTSAQ